MKILSYTKSYLAVLFVLSFLGTGPVPEAYSNENFIPETTMGYNPMASVNSIKRIQPQITAKVKELLAGIKEDECKKLDCKSVQELYNLIDGLMDYVSATKACLKGAIRYSQKQADLHTGSMKDIQFEAEQLTDLQWWARYGQNFATKMNQVASIANIGKAFKDGNTSEALAGTAKLGAVIGTSGQDEANLATGLGTAATNKNPRAGALQAAFHSLNYAAKKDIKARLERIKKLLKDVEQQQRDVAKWQGHVNYLQGSLGLIDGVWNSLSDLSGEVFKLALDCGARKRKECADDYQKAIDRAYTDYEKELERIDKSVDKIRDELKDSYAKVEDLNNKVLEAINKKRELEQQLDNKDPDLEAYRNAQRTYDNAKKLLNEIRADSLDSGGQTSVETDAIRRMSEARTKMEELGRKVDLKQVERNEKELEKKIAELRKEPEKLAKEVDKEREDRQDIIGRLEKAEAEADEKRQKAQDDYDKARKTASEKFDDCLRSKDVDIPRGVSGTVEKGASKSSGTDGQGVDCLNNCAATLDGGLNKLNGFEFKYETKKGCEDKTPPSDRGPPPGLRDKLGPDPDSLGRDYIKSDPNSDWDGVGLTKKFDPYTTPSEPGAGGVKRLVGDEDHEDYDPCKFAEPKGMTKDYRECSADCKTVCSYKTTVDEVNCFACQQGGGQTCKDVGLLDFPHPWCEPGGTCHASPDLYCTPPTPTVAPDRSKLTCTSCKKRPDECWKHVGNATQTLTNCRLGCWNGTCEYRGRYDKQEWDNSTEWIHCYECVTPPPPPTCEELGWGTDWESDCLNKCNKPGYCKEFDFEVGKKNPYACQKADTDEKKGKGGGEDEGGTRTRGGGNNGGGGQRPDGPGSGINDPTRPYGPNETAESTRVKTPCEEVSDGLKGSTYVDVPSKAFEDRQNELREQLERQVNELKERAEEIESRLRPQRERIQELESQLPDAQAELKQAKAAARGAEHLGSYGQTKLRELKAAQDKVNSISSELSQSRAGLQRQQASFDRDLNELRTEAQKTLYRYNPEAKLAQDLSRTDDYYNAWRDYHNNVEQRKISDRVFEEEAARLQSEIDKGGKNAEAYKEQLENLNRGRDEWNAANDRRRNRLAEDINRMQKENGEMGVGPYDLETLQWHAGNAAAKIYGQISKLKSLKALMEKAAANNCPPEGADKVAEEIDKKLKDMETMMRHLEDRYKEIEDGFPVTPSDQEMWERSARRFAEGSKTQGGVKTRADFFLESLGEETVRTITDPRVAFKKAFWYSVGVVEGVGKAIKGLVEVGVGALDLAAETIEGYLNSGDERLFGRDASETLQGFFRGADGNLNVDGLEKLAQKLKQMALDKEKQLLHTDMDKTVSRGAGQVVGEIVLGDKAVGKIIQGGTKLRTLVSGADEISDAGKIGRTTTKVPKGTKVVDGGTTGGTRGTSRTPDMDEFSGALDGPGTTTRPGGRTGTGVADDIPTGPKTTPKEPRGPPKVAKELDNTKPLDRAPDDKPVKKLDETTARQLETENGFRADHAENMHRFAQEHDAFLIVRDGNPDSVRHMDNPDFMPKPVTSKAKTAKVGPPDNQGLVVDPTHPTQAQYWDDAIAEAANAGDTKRLEWLKTNRRKAIKEWNNYGEKMQKNGYFVQDNGVIGYKDPTTGKVYKGIHGDYDLHGVYKAGPDGKATGRVSYGEGVTMDDGASLRRQLNEGIDPDKDYIQHGAQDDWKPDPKYVPNKPPDPPATVFFPDGRPPVRLETHADMKKFYESEMGVKFDYPDPPAKTGLSSGTGAAQAPPPAASTLPEFNGVKIQGKPVQGQPKVSTYAKSNSDLNFVDNTGNQVQLKTGEHLGSGSTSSVYVDAANPQQVIRVTDTMGDVKEAAKLDEFGRKVVEDISQQTDSIRIVRQVDRKVVQNRPGSALNNHVVEVVEKAENGTAKSMIAKQGGQLTEQQAQALNKAVKDLNDRGYAWLDAKPDNYGFEQIPGTDEIRVVVIDPGGIVPMKSPGAARKIQHRIQNPDSEFAEGYNSVGNPEIKDMVAGEEWRKIIDAHGSDIDIQKMDVDSVDEIKFNPSGNIGQPRVGQLFNESL